MFAETNVVEIFLLTMSLYNYPNPLRQTRVYRLPILRKYNETKFFLAERQSNLSVRFSFLFCL